MLEYFICFKYDLIFVIFLVKNPSMFKFKIYSLLSGLIALLTSVSFKMCIYLKRVPTLSFVHVPKEVSSVPVLPAILRIII